MVVLEGGKARFLDRLRKNLGGPGEFLVPGILDEVLEAADEAAPPCLKPEFGIGDQGGGRRGRIAGTDGEFLSRQGPFPSNGIDNQNM